MKLYKNRNLGQFDRQLRATIGTTSLLFVLIISMNSFAVSTFVAMLVTPILVSALIAWDPIYALFGISTIKNYNRNTAHFPEANLTSELLSESYGLPYQI